MSKLNFRDCEAQGWFLSSTTGTDDLGDLRIEKVDNSDIFGSDQEAWTYVISRAFFVGETNSLLALRMVQAENPTEWARLVEHGRVNVISDINRPTIWEIRQKEDQRYTDEPWAKLAIAAGFRPYDTESSARRAFEWCAEHMVMK